ncbi:MAG: hypothetical protein DLM69_04360, partial [Candidatus Chloroheliales bacterium]
MKIFAIINPVPVEQVRVSGGQLDFGEAGRIDPTSRAALVLALGFSDDVAALAVAGLHSDDALHEAFAYGAKQAISVASPNPGKISDPLADARLLDKAIHELAGDEAVVIFCGTGSDSLSPGVSNPLGAALAGLAGLQYIGGVEQVKSSVGGVEITARNGDALLTITAPTDTALVLGVSDSAIAMHTLPWAGGIINAYREGKVEHSGFDEAAGALSLTLNQLAPAPKREGPELLTDPPAEAAAALVELLYSRA